MSQNPDRPNVFGYIDYRKFLHDAYLYKKQTLRRFSYRYFAAKAAVASPAYLKLVIDGRRNIGQDIARRFATALELNKQETSFFLSLVAMNQAKTAEDRAHHYEELSRTPKYRQVKKLERSQYDYYALWYCIPVRELVARADFREDPVWIAKELNPPISEKQAKEALTVLLALGMIARNGEGKLVQAQPLVSTGPELRHLGLRQFHREMLNMAASALDRVALEEREVGGVTLRLTKEQLGLLKKRLFEIRQEVLQWDGQGKGEEAVFHFAFQLFPLSHFSGGPDES